MAKGYGLRVLVMMVACAAMQPSVHAAGQASAPADSLSIAAAQKLLDSGQPEEAFKALDALALKQPEPAGVARLRGMAHYQQGHMAQAADAFGKAVAEDPKDREAMEMEGVALFRMGRPADAVPLLEKAHVHVPRANVDVSYVLGLCYMDTRRYDDARRAFATQYGFLPDSAPAYLLAARMLLRREYLPIAVTFAQKALELNPSLPQAHLLMGQIKLAQSQLSEAVSEFLKERELNPLLGEVYDRLGDAYVRQGNYAEAQRALDQAVLLEPNSSVPFILLGKVLLKQQNAVMARLYLERALAIDSGNYMAHALMGQAYRALGQPDQASRETQLSEQIQAAAEPKLETLSK